MTVETREIKLGYIGSIENFNGDEEKALDMFDTNSVREVDSVDMLQTHQRIKKGVDIFYTFTNRNELQIYKLLPSVCDDEFFKWKKETFIAPKPQYSLSRLIANVDYGFVRYKVLYLTEYGQAYINVYVNRKKIDELKIRDVAVNNHTLKETIEKYNVGLISNINDAIGKKSA